MDIKDFIIKQRQADVVVENISKFDDGLFGRITDMSIKNDQALLQIDASHAGIINGNGMFYSPRKMKDGIVSFTKPYKIPILINHDTAVDPLGRVVKAEYVDFSKAYKDNHLNSLVAAVMKNRSKDEVHNQHASELLKYLTDKGYIQSYGNTYSGLGAARIYMNITDWQAVEKIKDGRYDTMSVSFQRGNLWCTDCNQYFMSEGCDHSWASDNVLMPDKHHFIETSYVNVPADVLAKMSNEANYHELALATMSDSVSRKLVGDKESNVITINTGIASFEDSEVSSDEQIDLENIKDENLQDEEDMPKDKNKESQSEEQIQVDDASKDGVVTDDVKAPVEADGAKVEDAKTEPTTEDSAEGKEVPAASSEQTKPLLINILNKDAYAKAVNAFIDSASDEDKARLEVGRIDLTTLDSLEQIAPEVGFIVTNDAQVEIAFALLDSHEAKHKRKVKNRIESAKAAIDAKKAADTAAAAAVEDTSADANTSAAQTDAKWYPQITSETVGVLFDAMTKEEKQLVFNKLFSECSDSNDQVKVMKQDLILLGLDSDSFQDESSKVETKYEDLVSKVRPLIVASIVDSEIRLGKAEKSEQDNLVSTYSALTLDELLVKFDFFSKIEDNNNDKTDSVVESEEGKQGNSSDSDKKEDPIADTTNAETLLNHNDTKSVEKQLAVKTNVEEAKLLSSWEKVFSE